MRKCFLHARGAAAPYPSSRPALLPRTRHHPVQSEGSYNWLGPAWNVPRIPSPWGKVQVPCLALGAGETLWGQLRPRAPHFSPPPGLSCVSSAIRIIQGRKGGWDIRPRCQSHSWMGPAGQEVGTRVPERSGHGQPQKEVLRTDPDLRRNACWAGIGSGGSPRSGVMISDGCVGVRWCGVKSLIR